MLTVDVHQGMAEFEERLEIDHGIINVGPALALGEDSPQNDAVTLSDAELIEQRMAGNFKECLSKGLIPSRSHHVALCPFPQSETKGVDDNRLARTRLAGKDIEPWSEFNGQVIDNGKAFNVELP